MPQEQVNKLLEAFDKAIEKKSDGKFSKEDVQQIYSAASTVFDGSYNLSPEQISQIRDRWVKLAEGVIDKGRAMKKLQGTSRAEAIQSVLNSML